MPFAVPKMKKHLAQTATFSKVQGGLGPVFGEFIARAVKDGTNRSMVRRFAPFPTAQSIKP